MGEESGVNVNVRDKMYHTKYERKNEWQWKVEDKQTYTIKYGI